MKANKGDIVRRINGFSTPFFGLNWDNITPSEKDHAYQLVTEFENHRALFDKYDVEVPKYVVDSIITLRDFLNDLLKANKNNNLGVIVRALRQQSMSFLSNIQKYGPEYRLGGGQQIDFFDEVSRLRLIFGLAAAVIASNYDLEIDERLASIVPDLTD